MVYTTKMLLKKLNNYKNPQEKLARLVKDGKYFPIIRGLYEDSADTPGVYLASNIYKPSYLSFEYALSHYGLIPEATYTYTSATTGKRRSKFYHTAFGNFSYRDIPKAAFQYGVKIIKENDYYYSIATAEKALCDKIYTAPQLLTQKSMKQYLFDNLRIDKTSLINLNIENIIELSKKYNSRNCHTLAVVMKGVLYEQHNK